MIPARSIPLFMRRRSGHSLLERSLQPTLVETKPLPSTPVLHCVTILAPKGKGLQFHSFDAAYLGRLRDRDPRTEQHFVAYFSALIQIKLRSKLPSREAIDDARQETFTRLFVALRQDKIARPECLGSYVNSTCNHVLMEQYRAGGRETPLDDGETPKELAAPGVSILTILESKQLKERVEEILKKLPERDRRLLREVFLEERDKDDVCRDFGVDREYLRVLLLRAKEKFKKLYLKHLGNQSPGLAEA